jgi:hypothetical protein
MHPYFTHRLAQQHREELMNDAETSRSAHIEVRPSLGQRFCTLLRRRRKMLELVRPDLHAEPTAMPQPLRRPPLAAPTVGTGSRGLAERTGGASVLRGTGPVCRSTIPVQS